MYESVDVLYVLRVLVSIFYVAFYQKSYEHVGLLAGLPTSWGKRSSVETGCSCPHKVGSPCILERKILFFIILLILRPRLILLFLRLAVVNLFFLIPKSKKSIFYLKPFVYILVGFCLLVSLPLQHRK